MVMAESNEANSTTPLLKCGERVGMTVLEKD
jgi:hypothetical protein